MTAETKPHRKRWKIAVGILLAVLVLLAGGFFWYVSDYYRAEDVALEVLAGGEHLKVQDMGKKIDCWGGGPAMWILCTAIIS